MPLLTALGMNAETLVPLFGAFDPESHFADGMNAYLYLSANPISGRDPLGLFDPFEDVDDQIEDLTGQKIYALGMINEGARWASLGLQTAVSIAASLLPGAGLYDAFQSVQVIANGGGGVWDAVNIATVAFPAVKGALGLRSLFKARRFRLLGCNCFVAGTQIDTPDGPVAIESVAAGDKVLTRDQSDPGSPEEIRPVTHTFRGIAPMVLWLTLANGNIMGVTPAHEVWTFREGWTAAGLVEAGDAFLGRDGTAVEIVAVRLEDRETPIYNLEVDGTFTYFASGVWVHNNSCSALLTKLGWRGQKAWKDAVKAVRRGGEHRTVAGKLLSYDEAAVLLQDAGCKIDRVHGAPPPTSVANRIDYPHINFTTPGGGKGHLGIDASQ